MKTKFSLLITLTFIIASYSQITFSGQIVINAPGEADGARSVYSVDLDGDGDNDVLFTSVSATGDKVAWYENIDGLGTFDTLRIISTDVDTPESIFAIDMDGDGDMDVLSSSYNDDKIAWYENTDGLGTFGPQQIIGILNYAYSLYATDIDGDNDIDVLASSVYGNKVVWYENVDGAGTFGIEKFIGTSTPQVYSAHAADLDGDGDNDILSASRSDSEIAWYQNADGLGNFGAQQIITSDLMSANFVSTADLDGDSDMDVVSSSYNDGIIDWYENTDGQGSFGPQNIITTNAIEVNSVFTIDIDNDGDIDLLSASRDPNKIAWYENLDGLGSFGNQQIISTNVYVPKAVFACDIDNDGDIDVLSASIGNGEGDGKIALYLNSTPLSVNENSFSKSKVYPNPVKDILTIDSEIAISTIYVFDSTGELVLNHSGEEKINMTGLNHGLYFIKIVDKNMRIEIKKVIKE